MSHQAASSKETNCNVVQIHGIVPGPRGVIVFTHRGQSNSLGGQFGRADIRDGICFLFTVSAFDFGSESAPGFRFYITVL